MDVAGKKGKDFSSNSQQIYQFKKCDFCLYHNVIFDQLNRLKEAIIIKNNRIKELEIFIAKISSMAFLKNPVGNSTDSIENYSQQNLNELNQENQNQDSISLQMNLNGAYFKKRFQQSSQISFQESKINAGKFEGSFRQNSSDFSSRFQKLNQLNDLKKQLQKRILETNNKQNQKLSQKIDSMYNSRQFETMRTLSEPHQQGQIGSIIHSQFGNSRLNELKQKKMKLQNSNSSLKIQKGNLGNQSMKKLGNLNDKSSMCIIKEQIKKLK